MCNTVVVLYYTSTYVRSVGRLANGCCGDSNGTCCPASSHAGDQQDQIE